jgi:hypothetical protein
MPKAWTLVVDFFNKGMIERRHVTILNDPTVGEIIDFLEIQFGAVDLVLDADNGDLLYQGAATPSDFG